MTSLKVLLFGAYGNGNFGDRLQAQSLGRSIRRLRPDIALTATSDLDVEDYPFDFGERAPRESIRDLGFVNSFDLLIIGGGGLLAHPHEPLETPGWVSKVEIPMALWGIGASGFFTHHTSDLIARAAFVSGRDLASLVELAKYKDDVAHICDPVIAESTVLTPPSAATGAATCWVVRGPIHSAHEEIARAMSGSDKIVAFEPAVDNELIDIFPEIEFVKTKRQFAEISGDKRVVSMRYHGLILAMQLGLPVMSLCLLKGRHLLERLGLGEFASDRLADLPIRKPQDTSRTAALLAWQAAAYESRLRRLLDRWLPAAEPLA